MVETVNSNYLTSQLLITERGQTIRVGLGPVAVLFSTPGTAVTLGTDGVALADFLLVEGSTDGALISGITKDGKAVQK